MRQLLTASILFLIISCNKKTITIEKWNQVVIDPKISKNKIYKELNKEKEIFSVLEDRDSTSKRSSDVSYFSGKTIDLKNNKHSRSNNCRAYFFNSNSDTLSINIGIGNGFGGQGFIIKQKNDKFYTEAYLSDDVITEGEIEPVHKIIYQKLTLDKTDYKVGDSLFGKIEFKSVETDKNNNQTRHFGKGYFRTKIKDF